MVVKEDQKQIRRLQQAVSQGLAGSGAVLSEMVGLPIEIQAPVMEIVPLNRIAEMAGGEAEVGVALYLAIAGEIEGHLLLFFSEQNAYSLVDLLLEQPVGTTAEAILKGTGELASMETSALSELCNVTGSFFLNALSDLTALEITPSTPAVVKDMLGSILDYILADLSCRGDQALMVETRFVGQQGGFQGSFYLLPTPEALGLILRRLEE
ncbi:MAG TPA: chemotaxis protein CheC [Bacillota bacterium]|nr:chemotaxis protein CheC [Bacillota bacterium]